MSSDDEEACEQSSIDQEVTVAIAPGENTARTQSSQSTAYMYKSERWDYRRMNIYETRLETIGGYKQFIMVQDTSVGGKRKQKERKSGA